MKLLLNIEIDINTGVLATSVGGTIIVKVPTLGTNICRLYFYKLDDIENLEPENALNAIYPIFFNNNNSFDRLITSCIISLSQQDLDSNTLEQIIYQKTSTSLNQEYGWTTSVI